MLIEDVTLIRNREIHLHIRWKGGATTSLDHPLPLSAPDLRRTSATVVELVRALATAQTDNQIAQTLNDRWLRTGTGQRFTRLRVRRICQAYRIRSPAQHKREAGWHTTAEIALNFTSTLKRSSATREKESSTPSASTTKVRFFSSRSADRFPKPIEQGGSAIGAATPNLHPHVRKEVQYEA